MSRHRILFLAANPAGLPERRLDEQARQIKEEILRAEARDRFDFITYPAARPMDLLRALREVKPSIVHFSGHTGIDGIYLVGDDDRPALVTRDALHATFGAAGRSVQIVVLNGCAAEGIGEALCELVPVCVGTPASTSDEAARAFSVGFYGALASSVPVGRACLQGRAAMQLTVIGEPHRPTIHHRFDVDPEELVLASRTSRLTDLDELDRSTVQKYIARYADALKTDPADAAALLAISTSYLKLGLHDLAQRFVQQLIDQHPAEPSGYYYRAICVLKGRRPRAVSLDVIREAEQLLATALSFDPGDGRYDALLAAIRHDYYVLNGMRVPAPSVEELMTSAEAKRVDRREVGRVFDLIKVNDGPVRQRFS